MEITKSTLHEGKGLILRKNVKKDEVVFTLSGKMLDHPTRESIHIGDNKHIYDENGIFIKCKDSLNGHSILEAIDEFEKTSWNHEQISMNSRVEYHEDKSLLYLNKISSL